MPKFPAPSKCRRLCVTMASQLPATAASRTRSSLGSDKCGPPKIEDLLKVCFRTKVVEKRLDIHRGYPGRPGARQGPLRLLDAALGYSNQEA
jgi:hypothetical protein